MKTNVTIGKCYFDLLHFIVFFSVTLFCRYNELFDTAKSKKIVNNIKTRVKTINC
jgi:hypothetical protein